MVPDDVHSLSPMIQHMLTALNARPDQREACLQAFWQRLETDRTPIIEDADLPTDQRLVTWIVRDDLDQPFETVRLVEPFSWRPREQTWLNRIPGTDIWAISYIVRSDLRATYGFEVTVEGTAASQLLQDPLARLRQADDWGDIGDNPAVLELPDALPLPWLTEQPGVARGVLHERTFQSDILRNERPVWVHTPHGFHPDAGPYPFVVIFDGIASHSAPRVIDNLVAAGEIPPLVAILVDNIGIRNQELTCNPAFSRAMADELVPWLRDEFALSTRPSDAALNGRSFGGLCSAWTALHHPDVFGNVIMQSGSCWMHPTPLRQWHEQRGDMTPHPAGTPADVPLIIDAYGRSRHQPIRIWQEVGTVENGPPPARIWQTFGNRWLHDILVLKGYDTTYHEFVGGHDDAWWRGTFADGLIWTFGRPPADQGHPR